MANDLVDLLASSRTNNAAREITGMLLHVEGSFLQVIEGEEADIDQLFETICADPRRGNITTIIRESISRRVFADWSMGFADVKLAEIEATEGFNAFLQDCGSVPALPPGRAQKLLTAFRTDGGAVGLLARLVQRRKLRRERHPTIPSKELMSRSSRSFRRPAARSGPRKRRDDGPTVRQLQLTSNQLFRGQSSYSGPIISSP